MAKRNIVYVLLLLWLFMCFATFNSALKEKSEDSFWCFNGIETLKAENFTEFSLASISTDTDLCKPGFQEVSVNSSTEFLAVHTSSFSLVLDLWPPQSVVHHFAKVIITDNEGEHEQDVQFEPQCFLSGKPRFGPGMVSLSYCNGLNGIIVSNDSDYQIISPRPVCPQSVYLLARRASSNLMQQVYKMEAERSGGADNFTMEVALFYDQSVYNYLEEKTNSRSIQEKLQYLLTSWNAVQYEFNKQNQLERSIKFVIKYINIFRENPSWYSERTFAESLQKICHWVANNNLDFDHVHIITNSKSSSLLGLGGSGGICDSGRCAISKEIRWAEHNIMCHEMAHGIDIPHDSHSHCKKYRGRDGLMGNRKTGWSQCSAKYFEMWINRGKGKCLQETNIFLNTTERIPQTIVNTFGNGLLPAMYTTPNEYCQIRYGKGFSFIDLYPKHKCGIISCVYTTHDGQQGRIKVDTGGTQGLPCGSQMVCRQHSVCEKINETNLWVPVPIITGGWSEWSPYSPCNRQCGIGVSVSTRQCNTPKPVGTEWCKGKSVRAKLCNTQACDNSATDITQVLHQRASERCATLVKHKYIDPRKFTGNGSSYADISSELRYFIHYPLRSMKGFDDLGRHENVSPSECAALCIDNNQCRSFEYKKDHRKCDLSSMTLSIDLLNVQGYWDLYVLPLPAVHHLYKFSPKHSIPEHDDLGQISNTNVENCARKCLKHPLCNSFEYKPQHSKCDLSSVTTKIRPTAPKPDWDHYEIKEDDDAIGKEGLCVVKCDLNNPSENGRNGHIALMPDGTPCSIDPQWYCLQGKCLKFGIKEFAEI